MMMARLDPEWEVTEGEELVGTLSISCNLTCCKYSEDEIICFSEFNFTDANNLTTWATWELAVRWTFASLVMLVAVLGNLTIIIILSKNRLLLRTSVNHFILNMSVADLILALTGPIPFTIRDTTMFWPLGEAWCYLEGYIQMLVMLVSLASLATISCDRMMGVVRPFHTHLKTWQSLTIIVVIWVFSALLAVPWGLYRVYTYYNAMLTVSQYMIYVNPAANPIIYGLLHQNFRRAFRLTFPCIFTRKSSLILTRGQGVTRYMWSVKSTGSQPSVAAAQRRHSVERQVQPSSPEHSSARPSQRLSGSKTLKDKPQKKDSHANSGGERKRKKKCCILKPELLARQKLKKEERWSPENDNDEGFCSARSSYVNERYVRDLPLRKVSIVSKGALGHLVTEVIEEETSSDAERERVL